LKEYATISNCQAIDLNELKESMLAFIQTADQCRKRLPVMMEDLKNDVEYHGRLLEEYEKNRLMENKKDLIEAKKKTWQENYDRQFWDIICYQEYVNGIEAVLRALPHDERVVLEILGQRRGKGDSIARAEKALHCGKSQVYRLRDRGLTHMLEILYGMNCKKCTHPCIIRDKSGTSEG